MHHQQQQQDQLIPARIRQPKEKYNCESKADERGLLVACLKKFQPHFGLK